MKDYTFNDMVSNATTLSTDPSDFCGEKILYFTIGGIVTTYITASNSDQIYFAPPVNEINFGDWDV